MKQKLLYSIRLRLLMLLAVLVSGINAAWGDSYEEGFEGKTAGSNYQGTVTVSTSESDCGIGWELYYGTVSTSSKISGSNSAALRLYSSSNNLGYLKTTTPIQGLSNVSFKAKAATSSSAKIKVNVDYSIDGSSWTTIASNQLFSSSATTYNYNIPSGGKYFRLIITSSSTKPTSGNAQLTIDDVVFTYTPAAALSSIALSGTYPNTFHQGDAFSHEGIIVTATYADDSQADVTASASFSDYDMSSTGVQTVTVSYTENEVTKTATYDITVSAPATLTSIALSGTYPTEFDYGAAFSSEGIVVTANYDDKTNKIVTGDATFSGYNMTSAGAQTVTVSYTENEVTKTATYGITVNAYVQPTSVTVNMNYAWLGSSNGSNISADKLPVVKAQDNVQITITDGTSTHPRGDDNYIRVYKGSTITFEAPSGYEITDITFTTGGNDSWTAPSVSSGTLDGKSWTGSAESVVFTLSGSCFISTAEVTLSLPKSDSDLTLTSSAEVELVKTSVTPYPTSTITWSTSSTGAMTFSSDDETVATVTDAGVITAVSEGSATITFSQAADEDYKASTNKVVTVTVTDNRSAVATAIDLSSDKTVMKDATAAITATSTMADGFTGDITYSYVSADPAIFSIADGKYTGAGIGETTVTVTATPTGGNAENYKAASQVVTVNVNGTNSISLDLTSKTHAYSAGAFAITATVPTENYNGTVTAESSNPAVATVSVDGTTVTVTPVAVGTANITVTAGADTYYPTPASETCAVTVTAPAGSTTAPSAETTYAFDFTDNTEWSFPEGSSNKTTESTNYTADGKTITLGGGGSSNGHYFNTTDHYLLMGKTGATLTLPAFDKPVTQIDVVGRSGASGNVTQNIFVGDDEVSTETKGATTTNEYEIDSEYQAAGNIYTLKVTNGNNTQITSIVVHLYQDPSATVKLNGSGYATFCSLYPLDFTNYATADYSAWEVTDISESTGVYTITFNQLKGKIKGGQGILLKGTAGETVTIASCDSENTLGDNMLEGTTAPTYVTSGDYYGLSGENFVPVNTGTVKAGKALLDADWIPDPSLVKSFTFVFNDTATGITETRQATREEVEAIFNLGGQRMSKMQRGVNIVNGKKVLVK